MGVIRKNDRMNSSQFLTVPQAHLHLALYVRGGRLSSTTYTETEMKSHSSDFKSFIYTISENVTGLHVTVYFSDVFTAFLRTSKRKNTAHRCPIQTEFRGTSPSFTRALFSKVSHFERECAQARLKSKFKQLRMRSIH